MLKIDNNDMSNILINSQNFNDYLGQSEDFVMNEFYINGDKTLKVYLAYIDGLIDANQINETVLKPVIQQMSLSKCKTEEEIIDLIIHGEVYYSSRKEENEFKEVISKILEGFCALIFDNSNKAIVFETKGFKTRSIDEPSDENIIKGAKDCFIESIRVNTSLIRRNIRTHNLVIEKVEVGNDCKKPISMVYLKNKADVTLVKKVKKRIENLKLNNILNVGEFEEQIVDNRKTIFPQIKYTERPDNLCANIMEGKIGIIIDGLPIVYIVPAVFNMFFKSPEDYSINYVMSSVVRCLRYFCAALMLLLPGFYIAITTFHHEMIPADLTVSIIKSKEGVPIDTFLEVILMLIAFEILMQAGARLPKSIGSTISIVGGLIVGDAAINAKFVSPGVVVVVAISSVAGFVLPNQDLSNAFRICRFLIVICASIAGLFGSTVALIMLIYHLATLETFGVPYLVPFSSNEGKNMMKDTLIKPVAKR